MIDGVTPQMIEATQAKFDKWDSIASNNALKVGTEDEKAEVYSLLNDPTYYSYAFFKNEAGEPFQFYPYQDLILNDTHKRILFVAANQIGKSIALCLKGLTFALQNPGTTTVMVSKTMPQSKDLLRQIKIFLTSSTLESQYDIGDSETKTEIYFRHFEEYKSDDGTIKTRELRQSRIICVPATEAALGYAAHLMLIDELAFYDNGEYFYKQIAQPRTYTTKGQIIVFSNPNGQQGIFWSLRNSKVFHVYKFDYLDCPTNTREEFEILCEDLTKEQIDSTLLAIFTSPKGAFISLEERKVMQEDRINMLMLPVTQPIYIFFDFGKVYDRTVRGIGTKEMNGTEPWVCAREMKEYKHGTSYSDIIDDLIQLIKEVGSENIALVGWDNTGVGKGIEDFIKKIQGLGVMCCPVEFSLQNKSAIYINFKLLIEKNLRGKFGVKIPKVTECDQQLSKLTFKKTDRGYLRVHHEKESDRDDYPDMLAGLCSLIIQPGIAPASVEVVNVNPGHFKRADLEQCDVCENYIDPWDEKCSCCGKSLIFEEEDNNVF